VSLSLLAQINPKNFLVLDNNSHAEAKHAAACEETRKAFLRSGMATSRPKVISSAASALPLRMAVSSLSKSNFT
jgi:hypothetical protein